MIKKITYLAITEIRLYAFLVCTCFSLVSVAQTTDPVTQALIDAKMAKVAKMNWQTNLGKINPLNGVLITGPEQDCPAGIVVCSQSYTQSVSYTGPGTIQEVNGTCLLGKETNSIWYIFTAQTTGNFGFTLTTLKDYDFALYDITTSGCAGVPTAVPVRCNFSATFGNTGMTPTGTCTSCSAIQTPFCTELAVTAGQTYALIVDNWSNDMNGYVLNFTTGAGYASITDVTRPTINPPNTVINNCNGTFTLVFSEAVKCSSIAADGSDFTLSSGSVTSAVGIGCSGGTTLTNSVTLTYTVPTSGTFTLGIRNPNGTDGNTILDKCGNAMLTTQTVTLNVLNTLTLTASPTSVCTPGAAISFTASGAPNSTGTYTFNPGGLTAAANGSGQATFTANPSSTTTYVVTMTYGGCTGTASATVVVANNVIVGINPVNPTICSGNATLTAFTTVNGTSDPGATFVWNPGGATTASISGVPGTTYSVTTVSSGGCVGTNTAVSTPSIATPGVTSNCNVYYVSPAGGGTGLTKGSPTTIQNALTLSLCSGAIIKMQEGIYNISDKLTINSFVTLEGGYNVAFTKKISDLNSGIGTTIVRSTKLDAGGTNTITGLYVVAGSNNFRFQDIRIELPVLPTTYALSSSYCTPASTGSGFPITNTTFAGINNSVGNPAIVYEDFYGSVGTANVTAGSSYAISVTATGLSPNPFYGNVFVDWNQNGDFTDAGEETQFGSVTTTAITYNGTINVPASALGGVTRMRVMHKFSAYTTPCYDGANNLQVEDYKVTVTTTGNCSDGILNNNETLIDYGGTGCPAQTTPSNYAIYLGNACNTYNIVRCYINAGRGGSGTPGTRGTSGGAGGNGVLNVAGAAGVGGGGAGGAGGAGSTGTNNNANGVTAGGAGGAKSSIADYSSPLGASCLANLPSNPTAHASDGASGVNGTNGTTGSAGSYNAGFYVIGGLGSAGISNGTGGGGGGGAARNVNYVENGGGGGGGGSGGTPGGGGGGVGSAFGIFSVAHGAGANIVSCQINATPGAGSGGPGGAGGRGGNGTDACRSGDGGNGGDGGDGGNGGSGGPGQSCLVCDLNNLTATATITPTAFTQTLIEGYPVITVDNITCNQTNISSSVVDATPLWSTFGGGETYPYTGQDSTTKTLTDVIKYGVGVTGRKTINFQGDVVSPVSTAFTNATLLAITDKSCTGVYSSIVVAGASGMMPTANIKVTVNITHTWDQDLYLTLIAPTGEKMALSYAQGGSGDNYTNTVFFDAGGSPTSTGAPPFTGNFTGEGFTGTLCGVFISTSSFSAFGGGSINPNGTWQLWVVDGVKFQTGSIVNWTITFPDFPKIVLNQNISYNDFNNILMAPPASGTIAGITPLCPTVSGNFSSSTAGTPGFTYSWTVVNPVGGANVIATPTLSSTGITFTNTTASAIIYTVNVAVTSGCCGLLAAPLSFTVSVNPGPAAPTASANPNPICPGATSTLTASAPASCTFQWYNAAVAGTLLSSNASFTVAPVVTTSYWVQATSILGCPGPRTQVTITVTPTAAPTVPNVTSCAPGVLTLSISAPIAGAIYSWYSACGGVAIQSSTATTFTVNVPGVQTNTYFVTVTAPGGCTASACTSVNAQVTAAPVSVFWTGAGTTGLNNWFDGNNWASGTNPAATYTNPAVSAVLPDATCPAPNPNTIVVSGYTGTVAGSAISVTVSTSHSADFSQLSMFLIAPNGTTILGLTNNRGPGASCTMTSVVFTDAGAAPMGATCPAVGAIFDPETLTFADCGTTSTIVSFGAFGAINPNGNWVLLIVDNTNAGSGTGGAIAIGGWSISFPSYYVGQCPPSCATNVTIPNTPALAVSNPPDIGYSGSVAAVNSITLAVGNTLSFSDPKAELDVCGNFTHTGNFKTSNVTNGFTLGKVVFMGTATQNYTNSNANSIVNNFFNDVIINNTTASPNNKVRLVTNNMTLGTGGSFTFQSGKLYTLSTNTLVITNTAPTAMSGYSATTGYVCGTANGEGNLRRYIQASGLGSYDFPVGLELAALGTRTAGPYYENNNILFTIAPTSAITWLNANFNSYVPPFGPNGPECNVTYNYTALDNGFWDITANNSFNNTGLYDMVLYNTGYTNASAGFTIMSRHNGSATWDLINGDGVTYGICAQGAVTAVWRGAMKGFSKFATAQSPIILPVELLSFKAVYNGKSADVTWTTASEINCSYFDVEKSLDGVKFKFLKKVLSKAPGGNSVSNLNYGINDPDVTAGTYYYRLRQYDKNGIFKYSPLAQLIIGGGGVLVDNTIFTVKPNPTTETAEVTYQCNSTESALLKVYDDRGRIILSKEMICQKGLNSVTIDLNEHSEGMYFIVLSVNDNVYKTKLVKVNSGK